MRRIDRQITEEQSLEILKNGEFGFLSFTDTEGYASGIPISYVYFNGSIYFHCAHEGHKLSSIEQDNRVCFCVVTDYKLIPDKFTTHYKSVIAYGRAELVRNEEKIEALNALVGKYSAGYETKAQSLKLMVMKRTKVVKITIEHITGKQNPVPEPPSADAS